MMNSSHVDFDADFTEYWSFVEVTIAKLSSDNLALTTATYLYMIPTTSSLGVFCNVLSLVVLRRDDTMPPTTSLILQMLATADTFNIVFTILLTSLTEIKTNPYKYMVGPWLYVLGTPLRSASFMASVWMQVLLTVERYLAVCYPMHVGRFFTLRRVRGAVVVVLLFAALFNVCRGFETYIRAFESDLNQTYFVVTESRETLGGNDGYRYAFKFVFYPTFNLFLPAILLVYLTTRILLELNKAFKLQLGLTNKIKPADEDKAKSMTSKHRRTTATFVSIVVVFVLLQLLTFVQFIFSVKARSTGGRGLSNNRWEVWYSIINDDLIALGLYSTSIQSTLNFFIFCLTGQRYRRIVAEAFGCHK